MNAPPTAMTVRPADPIIAGRRRRFVGRSPELARLVAQLDARVIEPAPEASLSALRLALGLDLGAWLPELS